MTNKKVFTDKDYDAADLLQGGLDHIASAEYLMYSKYPRTFDSAGYLAHIGIELMIKSWLLHKNKKFEGIHPLRELLDELEASVQSLSFTQTEEQTIDYLSKFEKLRYPPKHSPVEIGEEDIKLVPDLANSLLKQMPDNLIKSFKAIPSNIKGGRIYMRRPIQIPRDLEFETGIKREGSDE